MKKNILYFEDVFGWGGIETFMSNVFMYMDKNKVNISLVVVTKITNHFDKLLSEQNINTTVLLEGEQNNPVHRVRHGLVAFKKYLENKKNDIDAIHFNISNSVDMLYVMVAKKCGIKYRIVHSHNSFATSNVKTIAHYVLKPIVKKAPTHYFACSDKAAKWLFGKNIYQEKKYYLIKNAVNTEHYKYNSVERANLRHQYGLEGKFIVGHVGRFNEQKNHKYLIDIYEKIYQLNKNAILILIGEGELRKEIEKYVKEKSLTDKVIFWGSSSEVYKLLWMMDIFVLPSLYEGLPFVLVESQAASLASVVSDTITKEVNISKYISYVKLESNPEIWANEIIKNARVKREDNSKALIDSGFDLKTMIERLCEIYLKIIL